MAERGKIADMVAWRYDDPEIARAVLEDAQQRGTVEKIEAGELTLPTPHDAARWHEQRTGQRRKAEAESKVDTRLNELERRVTALEQAHTQPSQG